MGLYLGLSVIPALLVAFLSGAVVGVAIIAREGAAGAQEGRAVRRRSWPSAASSRVLAGPELIDLYEDAFLA